MQSFLLYFRLILVKEPLHYKRMVTKRRIHLSFTVMISVMFIQNVVAYSFLRKDLKESQMCMTANVLTSIGLYCMQMVNFVLLSLAMTVCYVLVILHIYKRKRHVDYFFNKISPKSRSFDSKLTKVVAINLSVYMVLYLPAVLCTCITSVVDIQLGIVYLCCMLLYFMNNVVNPFIYYITLKDFRQGYRKFLCCNVANENINSQMTVAVVET